MSNRIKKQRGEGKVGCTISLLVMAILVAIAIKIVPAYYANNQITDIVDRRAEQAAGRTPEELAKEMRTEIRKLDVPEAIAPNAISVRKTMSGNEGNVTVTLRYSRKVDLYGITDWTLNVDKTVIHPVFEGIK